MALADRIVLLNDGAVEQEGTAADLYKEPTSLFAAEFMGQSNRLEGTLVENAGTRAFIDVMGLPDRRGHADARRCRHQGPRHHPRRTHDGRRWTGLNRIPMNAQRRRICLGERWELVFVREALIVRAYTSMPLRHVSLPRGISARRALGVLTRRPKRAVRPNRFLTVPC